MTTKINHKKDARYLAAQLLERVPGVEVKVTSPSGRGTVWWIDASARGHNVVIEWSPDDGFGLSSTDGNDYNTAASETFADADDAVARIIDVLKTSKKVPPRREMYLQRLREHRAVSQEALADLMSISQASVSKTERREDMLLSTLRSFIEALGGHLQLVAKFPSETIELSLQSSEKRKRA
jgi:DNA-binding transcriptional regulator YiaG